MFSSNVGFRRRTVSEGYGQLFPPSSSSNNRSSSISHRYSLGESSSSSPDNIKRVVLRKHSGDPTGSRGLADRIARSEVENINGFWSRRISGQRRSYPCSPKQTEPNVAEWRREVADSHGTAPDTPGRSQTSSKPRGPRPLSKVSMTSPTQRSSYLVPSGMLSPFQSADPGRAEQAPSMASVDPAFRTETAIPNYSSAVTTPPLRISKSIDTSVTYRAKEPGLTYRPLLPPGLPVTKTNSDGMGTSLKERGEPRTSRKEGDKERRRFALELALNRLIGGKKSSSHQTPREPPSTALTVYNEKKHTSLLPPLILPSSIILPPLPPFPPAHAYSHIPIPPIPDSASQVSRSRPRSIRSVKSNKSSKSSNSGKVKRKSSSRSRKRKTGLARIVVELAKGEKIVAMDAEAIQEAAQVRDVLEQLRQMKAS